MYFVESLGKFSHQSFLTAADRLVSSHPLSYLYMLLADNLEPAIVLRVDVGQPLFYNVLPFLDGQGVILLLQTGVNCW